MLKAIFRHMFQDQKMHEFIIGVFIGSKVTDQDKHNKTKPKFQGKSYTVSNF
jgi:hypothetical protein